ncbi:homoserine/homoserine lactone efflux protein [Billgrantia endophytica]|uniref:Homoserine/homoserine lactone efflux protein n=1 Tax=Billgrantia endophytica TaxID=2033802 RepID=A0A2N7TXA8_9GAMM|nr:homoserine/homoserine lactone efflux protein [Halomonas endophytica]PMR72809.1 homoserine/homoserine lactone efflux protein [Halomonas endophytica]
MSISMWLAFLTASVVVSLSPGAGAVNTMNSGINYGLRYSVSTVLGLQLGYAAQILVVAVGLGALLASSTVAFSFIKWAGVAYLMWLGVQKWNTRTSWDVIECRKESSKKLFWKSTLINLTNPKATVFLVALLPQFLSNSSYSYLLQLLVLGTTLLVVDLIVMFCYAALASQFKVFITSGARMKVMNRIFGASFILAAIALSSYNKNS